MAIESTTSPTRPTVEALLLAAESLLSSIQILNESTKPVMHITARKDGEPLAAAPVPSESATHQFKPACILHSFFVLGEAYKADLLLNPKRAALNSHARLYFCENCNGWNEPTSICQGIMLLNNSLHDLFQALGVPELATADSSSISFEVDYQPMAALGAKINDQLSDDAPNTDCIRLPRRLIIEGIVPRPGPPVLICKPISWHVHPPKQIAKNLALAIGTLCRALSAGCAGTLMQSIPGPLTSPTLPKPDGKVERQSSNGRPISKVEWTTADSPERWAKLFGMSATSFKRRCKDGTIQHKKLSSKSYMVAIDDLPAKHQHKFHAGGDGPSA